MPTQVVDAPIVDSRFDEDVAVPANNAANTVQRLFNAYHGYREVLISTAGTAEMSVALPPRCVAAYAYDGTTYTDLLGGDNGLIDRSTSGSSGTALDGLTTASGKVFIAARKKFRGLWIEVEAANGTSNTVAVRYSKSDGTWAAASGEDDGTASGGASLAVDGNLTWTVPSDWGTIGLGQLQASSVAPLATAPLYWVELSWSADLGADVSIDVLGVLAEAAADTRGINNKVSTEYTFDIGDDVGGLELTATGTTATTCDISWIRR